MMKEEVARAWIADLRANGDKQGKKRLKHAGRYCCLGRLQGPVLGLPIERANVSLTDAAIEAAGMKYPDYLPPKLCGKLEVECAEAFSELNDSKGWTFARIADLIEKHWKDL